MALPQPLQQLLPLIYYAVLDDLHAVPFPQALHGVVEFILIEAPLIDKVHAIQRPHVELGLVRVELHPTAQI